MTGGRVLVSAVLVLTMVSACGGGGDKSSDFESASACSAEVSLALTSIYLGNPEPPVAIKQSLVECHNRDEWIAAANQIKTALDGQDPNVVLTDWCTRFGGGPACSKS